MVLSDTESASQAIIAYEHSLAEFITAWNRAEFTYRSLLVAVCGRTPAAYILTAGMGVRGLKEALLSYASDGMADADLLAVKHATEFFDRVLAYRNYYIHGIQLISYAAYAGVAVGEIHAVSSKGRFALHQELISQSEIETARQNAVNLHTALIDLLLRFGPEAPQRTQSAERLEGFQARNPWPDTLKKPRNYLLETHFRDQTPLPE